MFFLRSNWRPRVEPTMQECRSALESAGFTPKQADHATLVIFKVLFTRELINVNTLLRRKQKQEVNK